MGCNFHHYSESHRWCDIHRLVCNVGSLCHQRQCMCVNTQLLMHYLSMSIMPSWCPICTISHYNFAILIRKFNLLHLLTIFCYYFKEGTKEKKKKSERHYKKRTLSGPCSAWKYILKSLLPPMLWKPLVHFLGVWVCWHIPQLLWRMTLHLQQPNKYVY